MNGRSKFFSPIPTYTCPNLLVPGTWKKTNPFHQRLLNVTSPLPLSNCKLQQPAKQRQCINSGWVFELDQ
jgi:hypothetical protein